MADVLVRERPVKQRKYTVADFDWLAQLPQYRDSRFEIVEGEIVDMPPVGEWHGFGSTRIGRLLDEFVEATSAGIVTSETGYYDKEDDETLLGPDVAFRRRTSQRIRTRIVSCPSCLTWLLKSNLQATATSLCSARRGSTSSAAQEIVWLVYPERRQVEVCALDADGEITSEIVGADGELSGGDVLPGFTLPLSRLFS